MKKLKAYFIDYTGTMVQEDEPYTRELLGYFLSHSDFRNPKEALKVIWEKIKEIEAGSFGADFIKNHEKVNRILDYCEARCGLNGDRRYIHEIWQKIYRLCRGIVPAGQHPFALEREQMKADGIEEADFIADWSEFLFLSSFQSIAMNLRRDDWIFRDEDEEEADSDDQDEYKTPDFTEKSTLAPSAKEQRTGKKASDKTDSPETDSPAKTAQNSIQLRCFVYASAGKCADQLVTEDQKD